MPHFQVFPRANYRTLFSLNQRVRARFGLSKALIDLPLCRQTPIVPGPSSIDLSLNLLKKLPTTLDPNRFLSLNGFHGCIQLSGYTPDRQSVNFAERENPAALLGKE